MRLHEELGLDDMEIMNLMFKVVSGIQDFVPKEELFLCSIAIKEYFTAPNMRHRDILVPFMSNSGITEQFMKDNNSVSMAKIAMEDKDFKDLLIKCSLRIIAEVYKKADEEGEI